MRILIGGDFCPENRAEELLIKGFDILSGGYREIWNSVDFRIANLEGPITNTNEKINKVGRHIRFNPDIINGLIKMSFTHFSLANNHIMDYGEKGINETISLLDKIGIDYFGCHLKKKSVLRNGKESVSLLSFSNKEFSLMENNGGVGACSMDLINMLRDIEAAKKESNTIIVILHTGLAMNPLPSPEQRRLCRFIIDNGVDAVLCQHSHIMGAYEYYRSGFISYGQGSLVFDLNRKNSVWNQGYSVFIEINKGEKIIKLIPHNQFSDTLNIRTLNQLELDKFNVSMKKINSILSNDMDFNLAWEDYLNKTQDYYFNQFFLPKNRFFRKILNFIKFKTFISRDKKNILLSNLRNDEHAEVLKELLSRV